jgi:hypothetical protein
VPFIVTTTRLDLKLHGEFVSRRAVATLEEARGLAALPCGISNPSHFHQAVRLPESGGTVGPLPDGTVIEVEPVSDLYLGSAVPHDRYMTESELLAAYNTAQGS